MAESTTECTIGLGEKKMKDVIDFKYLGTVLCKEESMEGEVRERVMEGRQVMNGKSLSMGTKRGKRKVIILNSLLYHMHFS